MKRHARDDALQHQQPRLPPPYPSPPPGPSLPLAHLKRLAGHALPHHTVSCTPLPAQCSPEALTRGFLLTGCSNGTGQQLAQGHVCARPRMHPLARSPVALDAACWLDAAL